MGQTGRSNDHQSAEKLFGPWDFSEEKDEWDRIIELVDKKKLVLENEREKVLIEYLRHRANRHNSYAESAAILNIPVTELFMVVAKVYNRGSIHLVRVGMFNKALSLLAGPVIRWRILKWIYIALTVQGVIFGMWLGFNYVLFALDIVFAIGIVWAFIMEDIASSKIQSTNIEDISGDGNI
jgi:hypothetical protein